MNGAVVRAYSVKDYGNEKVTANFRVREFQCKDGNDVVFISEGLANVLQQIRSHFGKPVTINSGFRTVSHNKKEGGSPNSKHLYGMAADIVVQGVSPEEVGRYAETLLKNTGGIGVYKNFTHIDVRKTASRWRG